MASLTNLQRIVNLEARATEDEGRLTKAETAIASLSSQIAALGAAVNVERPPPPPPPGSLTASGPITSKSNGQIIEWLDITSTDGTAVLITHDNVIIRNCRIRHGAGAAIEIAHGIRCAKCASPRIENVEVIHVGPFKPSNPRQAVKENRHNIELEGVTGKPVISSVKCSAGARNIFVLDSPCAGLITNVQLDDVRGLDADAGGNNVQFNKSPGWTLSDFSCENGPTSFTEDNINCGNSPNITIQRGRIHYNNSPSGVGILLEFGSNDCLIEDVDCTQMGNGAFSGVQVKNSTFNKCRTRDSSNVARDGRSKPASNSLSFAATGGPIYYKLCRHFALANPGNTLWQASAAPNADIKSEDFTPRAFLNLRLPWNALP